MAFKKNNVKTELSISIPGGGELNSNYLDYKISECMKDIFVSAELLLLSRYINATSNQKVQPINVDDSNVVLNNAPEGSDYIRHSNLYEVTWDTSAISTSADYILENVKTRRLVDSSKYYIGQDTANASSQSIIFRDDYTSTGTYGLELWSYYSSTEEAHVSDSYYIEFHNALMAKIKYELFKMSGAKWFNPELSAVEERNYLVALQALKFKSGKQFSPNETVAKPKVKFLI